MPLCGFDERMLTGIAAFHEGLIEHGLLDRANSRGSSLDAVLAKEIRDMDAFLVALDRVDDPTLHDLLSGITNYARAFYRYADRHGISRYKETINRVEKLYVEMDRKFYDELDGKSDAMCLLATHLIDYASSTSLQHELREQRL